ncbi:hypothetical protein [Actinomadura sp. NBRC 104425]|uniref:hypothetical protein n=1 Tax=Actinomadura sp. NBRC 104425 TaxID=3032204 RepID=UPI0025531430|nr:hypothetical protein [Actinomadura sp. NBRC 104425]
MNFAHFYSSVTELPSRDSCREAELAARGLERLHRCEGWNMAVLSVRAEITVWARPQVITVTMPLTGTARFALTDVTELAEPIGQCNEDLNAR